MDPVVDMKEFYNSWRPNVQSWMNPCTLAAYTELQETGHYQAAHQLSRKSFKAHLFQLSRNLSDMVRYEACQFDDLSQWAQQLVNDFDTRRSAFSIRSAAPPADN